MSLRRNMLRELLLSLRKSIHDLMGNNMTMYITNTINLYDYDADSTTIKISPDGDGAGMVVVKADTKYYGQIDFSMDADAAIQFAEAIIAQAKMVKEMKI